MKNIKGETYVAITDCEIKEANVPDIPDHKFKLGQKVTIRWIDYDYFTSEENGNYCYSWVNLNEFDDEDYLIKSEDFKENFVSLEEYRNIQLEKLGI